MEEVALLINDHSRKRRKTQLDEREESRNDIKLELAKLFVSKEDYGVFLDKVDKLRAAFCSNDPNLVKGVFEDLTATYWGVDQLLHAAVLEPEDSLLKFVLDHKAMINMNVILDLFWACMRIKDTMKASYLWNYGINGLGMNLHTTTFLHTAIERGDLDELELLLATVNPNVCDMQGVSAIGHAIKYKRNDMVYMLLERGANIGARDVHGNTLLHMASEVGSQELVGRLLRLGLDARATNAMGRSALHFAAVSFEENIQMVEMLVTHGVLINGSDTEGFTPLHLAVLSGKIGQVQALIRNGADVTATTRIGFFPLYFAVEYCYPSVVEYLLKKGAPVNQATQTGLTALHAACKIGSQKKISILLKHGIDINGVNDSADVPLAWFHPQCKSDIKIVSQHLAEIKFKNSSAIKEATLERVYSIDYWRDYYEDCCDELERMSKLKVYNGITIYNVLTMGQERLVNLMRNDSFYYAFKTHNLTKLLPVYAEKIQHLFAKAHKRYCRVKEVRSRLQSIFGPHLPDVAVEKIVQYSI